MKKLILIIAALTLLIFITNAYSRTITVGHDAGYDYQTITAALSAAVSGDVILVADGTYSADTGESICFPMKDGVTLKRATPDIRPTLLGHTDQPVIYSEATGAKVEGFTITGGDYYSGAGIYIHSGNLEVIDCIITGNNAQDYGGGVRCGELSQPTFVNCTITENSTRMWDGGGVACWGKATFTNCIIAGNSAREDGGGIACYRSSQVTFTNCTITANKALWDGGGLYCSGNCSLSNCTIAGNSAGRSGGGVSGGDATFTNCTITGNSASYGGGMSCYQATIKNCIIWGNAGGSIHIFEFPPDVNYSCVEGGWSGTGNIDSDPRFIAWGNRTDIYIDASNVGFADGTQPHPFPDVKSAMAIHSLRLADDSPCIGGGESGVNMGADNGVGGSAGNTSVTFHVAAGQYNLSKCSFNYYVSLEGLHADQTVLKGTVYGLRTGCFLRKVTVTQGTDSGIKIAGGQSPSIEDCTIIANSAAVGGGGVYCHYASRPSFANCTITGNSAPDGGGVLCHSDSQPTLTNCIITQNSAREGGGVLCHDDQARFINCIIEKNSAQPWGNGGGVECRRYSQSTFINCTITANSAGWGGGVHCYPVSQPAFNGCVIEGNSSLNKGGGVYSQENQAIFTNCTITGNSAPTGGGVYYTVSPPTPSPTPWPRSFSERKGGTENDRRFPNHRILSNYIEIQNKIGSDSARANYYEPTPKPISPPTYHHSYGEAVARHNVYVNEKFKNENRNVEAQLHDSYDQMLLKNSIIWGNHGGEISYFYRGPYVRYCCIYFDPMFVNAGHWVGTPGESEWVDGDYHLQDSSPCIDAGDPDSQWNDACLPPGKGSARNDMGVYGGPYNCGWGEPTSPPVCFDFNTGIQGWGFAGTIAPFDEPNAGWDLNRLGISPAGSANCFSYWYSPEIIVEKDRLYRVSWEVSSTVNVADDALDFRLRANQLGNWRFWSTIVTSLNDAAPTTQTKTYDLIVLPEIESSTDTLVLSFDLVGFDPANDLYSWLYLDEMRMDELSITPILPTVLHAYYTFDTDSEGWAFQGKIGEFDEPLPVVEPGRIGLSPNGSPYCFSYWLSPEIQVAKDGVYKVSWRVSSSTSDPEQVVGFRLRCNQTSNLRAWNTGTLFSLGAAYPAEGEPRTYDLIILPQMSIPSDTIRLSFDILSFDSSNDLGSYIYLEEVIIREYLIQP